MRYGKIKQALSIIGILAMALGAIAAAIIVFTVVAMRLKAQTEWKEVREYLEARKEPMNESFILPAKIPDESNFFGVPLFRQSSPSQPPSTNQPYRVVAHAANPTGKRSAKDESPTLAEIASQLPQPQENLPPAQSILNYLNADTATWADLEEASRRPQAVLNYSNLNPSANYDFGLLWVLIAALKVQAHAALEIGDGDQAFRAIRLQFELAKAFESTPLAVPQMVRLNFIGHAISSIKEGLEKNCWNDKQLAALDSILTQINTRKDYLKTLRGERIQFKVYMDMIFGDIPGPQGKKKVTEEIGWFTQTFGRLLARKEKELAYASLIYQIQIALLEGSPTKKSDAKKFPSFRIMSSPAPPYTEAFVDTLSSKSFIQTQARVDLARTAIALQRYKLATGSYPQSLDELPNYDLDQTGVSIFFGRKIQYDRLGPEKHLLRSINIAKQEHFKVEKDWDW